MPMRSEAKLNRNTRLLVNAIIGVSSIEMTVSQANPYPSPSSLIRSSTESPFLCHKFYSRGE